MKKPEKQNTAVSIAVLAITIVGVFTVVGLYIWRNTRPLPPPVPVDMRPVEFEPTVTELSSNGEIMYVNEARYGLHGATMSDAFNGFTAVSADAAYGKLNIEAIGFVSENSELADNLSDNNDWSNTYGDYDLSKCVYVQYTTTDYTDPEETPAFPSIVIVTLDTIDGSYVSRQTVGTFCYDDDQLVCNHTEMEEGLTFYAIIPLEMDDEEGNRVDIRDISSDLVLRLNSYGNLNVSFDWLLGDSSIALITEQNGQYQEEVEAHMTLATNENQSAAYVPAV